MKYFVLVIMAVGFAACSKSSNNVTGPQSGPDTTNVSFSNQVQPIFTSNCALSGCHAGASAIYGQDLSAGHAYSSTVNVPSYENSKIMRIKPYQPDSSYLYLKITGASGISGVRMPYQRSPLDSADILTIKAWINQGAKNN